MAEDEDEVPTEDLAVVVGLPPEDGLPPIEDFPLVEGLALVDGELADGVEGLEAGGGVACATGVPPLDRL